MSPPHLAGGVSALLAYPGGKARIAARIAALLEPHRIYLEPFAGMASVLFAKRRAPFEIVNDADHRLVTFLRVVRDDPEGLAEAIALTPYSRNEYLTASAEGIEGCSDLEAARRVAILVGQSSPVLWSNRPLATQGVLRFDDDELAA